MQTCSDPARHPWLYKRSTTHVQHWLQRPMVLLLLFYLLLLLLPLLLLLLL
jgi:hypothetical protein